MIMLELNHVWASLYAGPLSYFGYMDITDRPFLEGGERERSGSGGIRKLDVFINHGKATWVNISSTFDMNIPMLH